jgi:hypothetical protein
VRRKKRKVWGEGKHGPVIVIFTTKKKKQQKPRTRPDLLTREQFSHIRAIVEGD